MEIITFAIIVLALWITLGLIVAVAIGKNNERTERHAYIMGVLKAVEVRGSLDRY